MNHYQLSLKAVDNKSKSILETIKNNLFLLSLMDFISSEFCKRMGHTESQIWLLGQSLEKIMKLVIFQESTIDEIKDIKKLNHNLKEIFDSICEHKKEDILKSLKINFDFKEEEKNIISFFYNYDPDIRYGISGHSLTRYDSEAAEAFYLSCLSFCLNKNAHYYRLVKKVMKQVQISDSGSMRVGNVKNLFSMSSSIYCSILFMSLPDNTKIRDAEGCICLHEAAASKYRKFVNSLINSIKIEASYYKEIKKRIDGKLIPQIDVCEATLPYDFEEEKRLLASHDPSVRGLTEESHRKDAIHIMLEIFEDFHKCRLTS